MMIDAYSATKLSILVGLACSILGFPIALFFGWLLARKNFRGKSLLTMVLFFPLSLPPVVSGLLLLKIMGRETALGQFFSSLGIPLTFSLTGATIASFVVGLPLYVMMIRSAFESVDKRYEEMAQTLGLSPVRVFYKVSLPLAMPGILAGAILAFARALGEFGATSIIAGNIEGETRTISLALYSLLDAPNGTENGRNLIIISLFISFISIAAYEYFIQLHRRRLEIHD